MLTPKIKEVLEYVPQEALMKRLRNPNSGWTKVFAETMADGPKSLRELCAAVSASSTNVRKLLRARPGFVEVMDDKGNSTGVWYYDESVKKYAKLKRQAYPTDFGPLLNQEIPRKVQVHSFNDTAEVAETTPAPVAEVLAPLPLPYKHTVEQYPDTYPKATKNYILVQVNEKRQSAGFNDVVEEMHRLIADMGTDPTALHKLTVLCASISHKNMEN